MPAVAGRRVSVAKLALPTPEFGGQGPDRGARNRGYVRAALLCAGITEAY